MEDTIIPANLDSEAAVLGIVLVCPEKLDEAKTLSPSSFYSTQNKFVWEAIAALDAEAKPVDIITVSNRLKETNRLDDAGGRIYVTDLSMGGASPVSFNHHVAVIQEAAGKRALLKLAGNINESIANDLSFNHIVDQVGQRVSELHQVIEPQEISDMGELGLGLFEELEFRTEHPGMLPGLPSGFTPLDEMTGGFQAGHNVILGGRSSMGKTAFVMNLALNAARYEDAGVLVISLDMTKQQLMERLMSKVAMVDGKQMQRGIIDEREWGQIATSMGTLTGYPIYMVDSGIEDAGDIRTAALKVDRALRKKGKKLELVIVDYIQLLKSSLRLEDRVREVSRIAIELKALARELNVAFISLSQLSRAAAARGKVSPPTLTDLKESGTIEEQADLVLLIHRDEYYNPKDSAKKGEAEIIVAKNRFGQCGSIDLIFRAAYSSFHSKDYSAPMQYLRREEKKKSRPIADHGEQKDYVSFSAGGIRTYKKIFGDEPAKRVWSSDNCDKRYDQLLQSAESAQIDFWKNLDKMPDEQPDEMHKQWARDCVLEMHNARSRKNQLAVNLESMFNTWEDIEVDTTEGDTTDAEKGASGFAPRIVGAN